MPLLLFWEPRVMLLKLGVASKYWPKGSLDEPSIVHAFITGLLAPRKVAPYQLNSSVLFCTLPPALMKSSTPKSLLWS